MTQKDRPQNRNLKPNRPLPDGVQSKPVRIRAAAWAHEALRSMTPAEIGQILERKLETAAPASFRHGVTPKE